MTAHKPKVLVIIPDRFTKASGGMGENSLPVLEKLSPEFDFYVAGFPLMGERVPERISGYHEVLNPFTEVHFGPMSTMNGQIKYFAAAITFPKPDLIYAYDWSVYLAAVEAAKFFGVPLVARMSLSAIELGRHGQTFGLNLKDPVHKALHNSLCEMEIRGLKAADHIVHISRGYAGRWDAIAPFKQKSSVVPNGIDLEKWQKPAAAYAFPGTRKYKVVFIGRIVSMKGIMPLCQAKVPADIDLIFIGSKEFAESACFTMVEQRAKNDEQVHYLGPLYGEEKVRALKAADAIIIPSYHEPFGTVGLEGLASESIVISSRVDGLGDYLDDTNSLYCGTSPETIEKALAVFTSLSEEKKADLKKRGLEVCRVYSVDHTAAKLAAIFHKYSQGK